MVFHLVAFTINPIALLYSGDNCYIIAIVIIVII